MIFFISGFRKKVFLMSKLILLIFILLLSINSATLAFPNEPTSFRGLSWGASIEELKEKYPNKYTIGETEDDISNVYIWEANDSISNVPICPPVRYTFLNNQLFEVSIALSKDNAYKLLSSLNTLYGTSERKSLSNGFMWRGNTSIIFFDDCKYRLYIASPNYILQLMKKNNEKKTTQAKQGW
jgi:hypothetical protein